MSRLAAIRSGINHSKSVYFPGTKERVRIAVLSSQESVEAQLAADQYCQDKRIIDPISRDIVLQQELIFRFLREEEDPSKALAKSIDEVRAFTNDELGALMDEYESLRTISNPSIDAISEKEFEELKESLKKTKLSDLSGSTARLLTLLLTTLDSERLPTASS